MFTLQDLVQPETIQEAYNILIQRKTNTILGGCAFLRMGSKRIGTAIDLSKLDLNYIKDESGYIEIGAMTNFREIETSTILRECFNGVLPRAVSNIIGVQFRNIVTVGATLFSKYGFSDVITAFLVLDTEVELYKGGRMTLEEFIEMPFNKDILTRIFIKKNHRKASFIDFRNSASDYSLLNVAVSEMDKAWKIAVGARPAVAKIAKNASEALSNEILTDTAIGEIAALVSEELVFGGNMRASGEYRKALCKVMVKRAVKEILECR